MNNKISLEEKCTGAFLASAIGDALGWPNEYNEENVGSITNNSPQFIKWDKDVGEQSRYHFETILPGEYSENTQMVLAVARSIMTGNWQSFFTKRELPYWLEYERSYSYYLKNAAAHLMEKAFPWEYADTEEYFYADGSEAVVRILPHVIRQTNIETLISDVIINSIFTNGHPKAILGATCFAFALFYLLNKKTMIRKGELISSIIISVDYWSKINPQTLFTEWLISEEKYSDFDFLKVWDDTVSRMKQALEYIEKSLRKPSNASDVDILRKIGCFGKNGKTGAVTVLSSLYLASKYAENPILGIQTAANCIGSATNSIASMTGAMLGMMHGTSWIPSMWKQLQDYDCIANMAKILIANNMTEAIMRVTDGYQREYNDWIQSPIGKIRVVETSCLPCGKSSFVTIKKAQTMLGQTLYLKIYENNSNISIVKNMTQ